MYSGDRLIDKRTKSGFTFLVHVHIHLCTYLLQVWGREYTLGRAARDVDISEREFIRESVDPLCRDGSSLPIVCVHWKAVANDRVLSLSGPLAILFERFSTQ